MQYRREIFNFLDSEFEHLSGEIECDESYFGGKRKGNRRRGSVSETKVFGMPESQGKIFTTVVDIVIAKRLIGEIKDRPLKLECFIPTNLSLINLFSFMVNTG